MEFNLIYDAYERRSSEDADDRQVASIESQDRELKDLAKKLNLKVRKYISESKSAHKIGREAFDQLILDIDAGKINAILVYHANRLARNAFDAGRLIYLMDEAKLLEIRTPTHVYKNTPEEKFMLGLEFGMSKKDSDDKGVVVKRGLKQKLLSGWRPGVAPEGYLNDKVNDQGEKTILTDPDNFPFIKQIFQLFYQGTSVREICRIANDEWHYQTRQKKRLGGKPLSISLVYFILTNPFYAGSYEYPIGSGDWYEGKHERAVESEVFDKIQILLGGKGRRRPHTHEFAFTGLMRCPCGAAISAEEKFQVICTSCKYKFALTRKNSNSCPNCQIQIENMSNPTLLHYVYYHCTKKRDLNCIEKSVEVAELERQIAERLEGLRISEVFMDWAIRQIHNMHKDERGFRENKIKSIQQAHNQCRQKLDNLLALKIAPLNNDGSLLSDQEYSTKKIRLEKEFKDLELQLTNADTNMIKAHNKIAEKFDFACRARNRFATGNLATRREILDSLGSNPIIKSKTLDLDIPKYYLRLEEMKENDPTIAVELEPGKSAVTVAQLEESWNNNPSLHGWKESNPRHGIWRPRSYH